MNKHTDINNTILALGLAHKLYTKPGMFRSYGELILKLTIWLVLLLVAIIPIVIIFI